MKMEAGDNLLFFSILLILCTIPSLLILWNIYKNNNKISQPSYLLTGLFIGGIIAGYISIYYSDCLKIWFPFLNLSYNELNISQTIFKLIISIAFVEESSKWIINYLITWKNKHFKYSYNQIIYCVFVSIGFAILENVIYGFSFAQKEILPNLIRGVLCAPCHATFGIAMGYYLGIAKNALIFKNKKQFNKNAILSILVPMILHTIYNLLLIKKNKITYILFIIYILFLIATSMYKIKKLSSINKTIDKKDISNK